MPPERFVAERDEAAAAARRAGDRERAAAIAKLRKPTVAAWLVNLLAWQSPDLVDGLLRLGDELRAAQRDLRGDRLRELSARRRGVVGDLAARARELAVAAGRSPRDELPLAEVEETLTAALADEQAADEVREGRLTRTLSYAGFGETPRPRLRLVEPPAEKATGTAQPRGGRAPRTTTGGRQAATVDKPTKGPKAATAARTSKARAKESEQRAERERKEALRRADREVKAAQTEARRIEAELAHASEAEQQASRKLRKILQDLDDLQRRRDAADAAATSAKLARKSAERAAARAARRLEAAQDAADAARG